MIFEALFYTDHWRILFGLSFRIPAEMLDGEESTVIESISLKPFLNDEKLFDLLVYINLKKNMADYEYTELEMNPHRNVRVSVHNLFYSKYNRVGDLHTSNEDLAGTIDWSTRSKYFFERRSDNQVTYLVFVKSLWADELYDLKIDTRSFKRGSPLVRVQFRLV